MDKSEKRERKSELRNASAKEPELPPGTTASSTVDPAPAEPKAAPSFPIAGIGASAGGLEAFSELLRHLPTDTGMAFVLVQHLDPTHESQLTNLLAKTSALPVHQAQNEMAVVPNQVYVIPPNAQMTIGAGVLKLIEGRKAGEAQHAIDLFLESLAREYGSHAIGVILSGSASNGTLGLEAIKNEGGVTFAQDASAKYDSMPRNAIASGSVDYILPPAKIAEELGRLARLPQLTSLSTLPSEETCKDDKDYKKILQLLKIRTGADFTLYKPASIQRRLSRRMVLNKTSSLSAYLKALRARPSELDALYQDVLINVTGFFRDPEAFETLKQRAFPKIVRGHEPYSPVRMWVLGCSTGQEVYSLAMTFLEYTAQAGAQVPLQIFGTDLNDTLLDKARAGIYSKSQVAELSPERLRRFFAQEDGGFRVCKPLRELCLFARHDIQSDPPFSRMDLLSCRNVMIYLEPVLQRRLMPIFHYALNPNGFLLLGNSESIVGFTDLFSTEDKAQKLYSRKPAATRHRVRLQPKGGSGEKTAAAQASRPGETEVHTEADRVLLAKFAPAGVLVNDSMEILQFRGRTGPFLEPPVGRAVYNLFKMAREGLLAPVQAAIQKARRETQVTRLEDLEYSYEGKTQHINLEVIPLQNAKERCFLVLFEPRPNRDAPQLAAEPFPVRPPFPPDLDAALRENSRLRAELSTAREYLQSVTEQYEAVNEELQAANEEAQSSNEELQTINEELESAKEEMQSTNEELTTVNDEMTNRNAELLLVNGDLNNILNGVQMCIVVLGGDLCIRRFTLMAEKILNLVPTDVGRPIGHIGLRFEFQDLEAVLLDVINNVRPYEKEVQDKEGRWYSLRILPYKTFDSRIDGAVLLLVDIDPLKRSEQLIKAALEYAVSVIETVREPLLVLDSDLRIERVNRSFSIVFRVSPDETQGRLLYEIGGGQWNNADLRSLLQEVLANKTPFNDFEVERDFERIGHRSVLLNARPLAEDGGPAKRILLGFEDVTERKQLAILRESEQHFRTLAESLPQLVWTCTPDGQCDYFNSKWPEYTGMPMDALLGMGWRESLHGEDRNRTGERWWAALRGQAPYDLEYRIRRADGEYHWFKVRATPIWDGVGNILKWFGTCTDIEDQKQIELELQRSRDELESRVKERTARLREIVQEMEAFSYSVSHDLRSPLRAMLGFVDLAIQEGGENLPPKVKDYLQRVTAAAGRADRLVQDLLTYSRVARTDLNLSPIDVDALLRDIVHQSPAFQAPRVDIQVQGPLPKVLGHESSLTQCITNLLGNVVKFVLPGITPHVKIWAEPRDGQVRIWFEDNGIGIESANVSRIFGIFERVHSTQQYEGTGIGLAIVRKQVERMGGSVGVESEPGNGSKFWLQLRGAQPLEGP
jgi:two-component system CheB/CheR fusion protein